MTVITLLSDFGLTDSYVAQMKAVVLSTSPNAEIVDISHGIEKHSIAAGSYILETTVPFFPAGSVHVAVVDPGVGGDRLPIAIECEQGVVIGPDNGLLARAADKLGFQAAYRIANSHFIRDVPSSTFHGRDIFAFAAAGIAAGHRPNEVGPPLSAIARLDFPEPSFSRELVSFRVLYVDSFGNIVTNISSVDSERFGFRQGVRVKIVVGKRGSHHVGTITTSYFDIPSHGFGVLRGSQGYLEIALKEASAAATLGVKTLDSLEIQF